MVDFYYFAHECAQLETKVELAGKKCRLILLLSRQWPRTPSHTLLRKDLIYYFTTTTTIAMLLLLLLLLLLLRLQLEQFRSRTRWSSTPAWSHWPPKWVGRVQDCDTVKRLCGKEKQNNWFKRERQRERKTQNIERWWYSNVCCSYIFAFPSSRCSFSRLGVFLPLKKLLNVFQNRMGGEGERGVHFQTF